MSADENMFCNLHPGLVKCPLADVGVLLKSILRLRLIVTEAFGTQAGSDEVMTELNDVTLQWQETCTSIISHMLRGVTLPGSETIEPLKHRKQNS